METETIKQVEMKEKFKNSNSGERGNNPKLNYIPGTLSM